MSAGGHGRTEQQASAPALGPSGKGEGPAPAAGALGIVPPASEAGRTGLARGEWNLGRATRVCAPWSSGPVPALLPSVHGSLCRAPPTVPHPPGLTASPASVPTRLCAGRVTVTSPGEWALKAEPASAAPPSCWRAPLPSWVWGHAGPGGKFTCTVRRAGAGAAQQQGVGWGAERGRAQDWRTAEAGVWPGDRTGGP